MKIAESFQLWSQNDYFNELTRQEIIALKDEKEIEDRFYKDLEFGTGGLRGLIGAGTNRMNVYTVRKASQGVADYINESQFPEGVSGIALAYDSRRMSREFAMEAASVCAANGVKAYIFKTLMPTPILSYTVRYLKCAAGIVVTASHNPKEYNGYKVYGMDGGQITDALAEKISDYIEKVSPISAVKLADFEGAVKKGMIEWIDDKVFDTYMDEVLALSGDVPQKDRAALKIVYSPLHGTGLVPVTTMLQKAGFTDVTVVKEQSVYDSEFTTVQSPNPEDHAALSMGIAIAKEKDADLVIATDPDCDRLGLAYKNNRGEFEFLNGNQLGCLMLNIRLRSNKSNLKPDDFIIKTVVTTKMANAIARDYGVKVIDVLTGFKYIGEKIEQYKNKKDSRFIFGFEESYGYLAGDFVRDKDAVIAAMLACEAAADGKSRGLSLGDTLIELHQKYGYYLENLKSYTFYGKEGKEKIASLMRKLRSSRLETFCGQEILHMRDYLVTDPGVNPDGLPQSDVLYYDLADGGWFAVRPSGTEPKLKIYMGTKAETAEECEKKIADMERELENLING